MAALNAECAFDGGAFFGCEFCGFKDTVTCIN